MRYVLPAASFILGTGQVLAKDVNCLARMLTDVPADEAPEQVKSKNNGDFGPIIQIKVNKKTGKMSYCSGGSYCYNSNAFQLTTPCRIKRDVEAGTSAFFSYFTR